MFSLKESVLLPVEVKNLHIKFKETSEARNLLEESLKAHKISDNHNRAITEILEIMSEVGALQNADRTITGRKAYDTMTEANIR